MASRGLIHSHHISPPSFPNLFDLDSLPSSSFVTPDFKLAPETINSSILDFGTRIGQCLNGFLRQFFRGLPLPVPSVNFRLHEAEKSGVVPVRDLRKERGGTGLTLTVAEEASYFGERLGDVAFVRGDDEVNGEDATGFTVQGLGRLDKPQGTVNVMSSYNSRTREVESSMPARGDLWRVEASQGSSTSGNNSSSLFLVQLGPVFVRARFNTFTARLPVKATLALGIHSLCPAVRSKHRRWLMMSMLSLNPFACNKWRTRITPMVQLPDKSFSLGVAQSLAWQRSGIMYSPAVRLSLCPIFGGSNPGLHAEIIHSIKERLSLIFGCSLAAHPSAFASVSIGRSKWNGNVGRSGLALRVDAPLCNFGRPSFSIQINIGIEF